MSTNRHVAFLRGINLGGRRIKNDRLRELFEALDLDDVATYMASGNVIFDAEPERAAGLEPAIEDHLARELGYDVDTFIRSMDELETIDGLETVDGLELDPAALESGHRVHVAFLRTEPEDDDGVRARLRALETDDDTFRLRGREVYWLRGGRLSDADVTPADLTKAIGGATHTMRTMRTVRRIVAKFSGART